MIEQINKLHILSFLNKNEIYKNYLDKFSSNLGEVENNPFLGFIGKDYFDTSIKICFVAKAGGESRFLTSNDMYMNEKFIMFRNATEHIRLVSFYEYQEVVKNHIQDWNVFRIPKYLNSKINQNIDNISYVNIVPFRYKGGPTKSVYKIAWDNFTNNYLKIINPDYIIPLGKNLGEEVVKNYLGSAIVTNGITRTNGDNYLHKEAIEQMNIIANRIKPNL